MRYDISVGVTGRKTAKHSVRNSIIGMVVVVALLLGAGAAYTYYFGPDGTQQAATPEARAPQSHKPRAPTKPAANAPSSVSVQMIMSPDVPGGNASVAVKTLAGAACTIGVTYGTLKATDSGLAPKKADEYGVVNWSWTVDRAAPAGTWPVKITCVYNGRSAIGIPNLIVPKG